MVRTRMADPTGAFDLVIGGRNTPLLKHSVTSCSILCDHIRPGPDVREKWCGESYSPSGPDQNCGPPGP